MRLILAFALALAFIGGTAFAQAPGHHTPPACWTAPRITHGPWGEQPGERQAREEGHAAGGQEVGGAPG